MLIASIVLVCLLVVFIIVTYILTIKNYTFEIGEEKLQIKNRGSRLKIFVNDKMIVSQVMPQLIHGERYEVEINGKMYIVDCKCNGFGNKMRIEIYADGQLIKDNGVVLPEKKTKK